MSVEIHEPEIEMLIEQRMATGAFQNVEAVLLHALKSAPVPSSPKLQKQNFSDFMMESPCAVPVLSSRECMIIPIAAEL